MGSSLEKLKERLEGFRWIDDIPEDQNRCDEICLQGKAALLIEANVDSEMFSAFIRLGKCSGGKSATSCSNRQFMSARPVIFTAMTGRCLSSRRRSNLEKSIGSANNGDRL